MILTGTAHSTSSKRPPSRHKGICGTSDTGMGRAKGRAGVVGREGYRGYGGRRQQQLETMGNCESKPQRLPEEQDDSEKAILFTTYPESGTDKSQ